MNYNQLRNLCEIKGKKMNRLAVAAGMTYSGFKTSVEHHKICELSIAKCCDYLEMSPNDWFGYKGNDIVVNSTTNTKNQEIAALKDELLQTMRENMELRKQLDALKEKNETKQQPKQRQYLLAADATN